MAFDLISGGIAITSILIIVIATIVLYVNMQNNRKREREQLEDVIQQINASHKYFYKKMNDMSSDLQKKQTAIQHQLQQEFKKDKQDLEKKMNCIKCP
jgi:uncharacterized protein HemX